MNLNKVMLIGRLGKDPEVRIFEGDVTLASFPMATTEYYKDQNGNRQEKTEWHNVSCWRKLGDLAKNYLKKGSLIYIEGKLQTRTYGEGEQKKYFTEVIASDFRMLEPRGDSSPSSTSGSAPSSNAAPAAPTLNSNKQNMPESNQAKTEQKQENESNTTGFSANNIEDPNDLPF